MTLAVYPAINDFSLSNWARTKEMLSSQIFVYHLECHPQHLVPSYHELYILKM